MAVFSNDLSIVVSALVDAIRRSVMVLENMESLDANDDAAMDPTSCFDKDRKGGVLLSNYLLGMHGRF